MLQEKIVGLKHIFSCVYFGELWITNKQGSLVNIP